MRRAYCPRGALDRRTRNQIGTTITAPSRKYCQSQRTASKPIFQMCRINRSTEFENIPRIEPDRGQDHADQDRQQDQPADHRQRRPTEEALHVVSVLGFWDSRDCWVIAISPAWGQLGANSSANASG